MSRTKASMAACISVQPQNGPSLNWDDRRCGRYGRWWGLTSSTCDKTHKPPLKGKLNKMSGTRETSAGWIDILIYVKYHCINARQTIFLCRQTSGRHLKSCQSFTFSTNMTSQVRSLLPNERPSPIIRGANEHVPQHLIKNVWRRPEFHLR